MPFLPNPIVGKSSMVNYLNRHRDTSRSFQPSQSPGGLVSQTVHGSFNEPLPSAPLPIAESVALFFPFKIYESPADPEGDPTVAWRTFRVRGGWIIIDGMGDDPVAKTDAAENPDLDPIPDFDGTNIDFVVPDAEGQHWVWVEITGNSPYTCTVKHGSDPTTNGWSAYPAIDDRHIPLGYIDTDTRSAEKVAVVRQLARTDLIACPPADI